MPATGVRGTASPQGKAQRQQSLSPATLSSLQCPRTTPQPGTAPDALHMNPCLYLEVTYKFNAPVFQWLQSLACKASWDTLHGWGHPLGQGWVGGGARGRITAELGAPGTEEQPWVSPLRLKEVFPSSKARVWPGRCRKAEHAGLWAGCGEALVFNKTVRCCDLCPLMSAGLGERRNPAANPLLSKAEHLQG